MSYRWKVIRCLYPYANGAKWHFGILSMVSALIIGLEFVTPVVYKIFINDVIVKADISKIKTVISGYLAIYLVGMFAGYIKVYTKCKVVNTILYYARKKILNNYLNIPFAEYENVSVGDLKMRIDDDTKQVAEFAGGQTIDYFLACATIVVSIVILFATNWIIAIFSIIAIPFTFWLDNIISKREKVVADKKRDNLQGLSSWMHSVVQGWREVKALNLAKYETRQYYRFMHDDMRGFAKWINYWTTRALIIPKIKNDCFMQFGLYFIGGLLIISGQINIGELLVFAVYYSMLSEAVKMVSAADADLQSNMPYTDRLMESLSNVMKQEQIGIEPDRTNEIVFDKVSFKYPSSEQVIINSFNLTIKKGEKVAITGKSGSGKTTLLKLITGMLIPTSGIISFSGIDLREIDIVSMHKRIGYVMQENILFNATIRENLLYGKSNASEEELVTACKKAYIYEFIQSTPGGFDTIIGEKGIKLSGGQRQRIVLARMFLQDIDIFIFDEATSALDQYSESIVHDAIKSIAEDKTIIIVAHRESSIKLCNRVIRLE